MLKRRRLSGSGSGKRLGWREKKLLLVALKLDEQYDGSFWWEYVPKELGIFITHGFFERCLHREKFEEEDRYKKAMTRLLERDLARVEIGVFSPKPMRKRGPGSGYLAYALTEKGRKVARELKKQKDRKEDLNKTLETLTKQGYEHVTLKQIRELLWRLSHDKFQNREEFDGYWSKRRLGLMLKKMGIKRGRIGKMRTRIYYLG